MVEAIPSGNYVKPAAKIVFLVANTFYGTLRGMQVNGEDLYKPPNLPFDVNQARTDVENAKKERFPVSAARIPNSSSSMTVATKLSEKKFLSLA